MLHFAMELWMFCHCDGRLVILVDNSRLCRTTSKVIRQLSQPDHFLSSTCQCHVLCLGGGQSNTRLFLATPAHWCPTQTEQVTRCRLAVINVSCPVRIAVSSTLCRLVVRVLETQVLCALQVTFTAPFTAGRCSFNGLAQNRATQLTAGLVHSDR